MANKANEEIQKIFEESLVPFIDEAFRAVARKMQLDLTRAGVVLTTQLRDSIESEKLSVSSNLEAEFRLAMQGYGRYKDMRTLEYDEGKPAPEGDFIQALEKWVEEKGIRTFKYVPGYFNDAKRRVTIPESRARNRIAWGVAMGIVKQGTIRRKAKFWNSNRGKVYGDIQRMIEERLPEETLNILINYYNKKTED